MPRLPWSAASAWSAAPRVTHGHRIWLNSLLWYLPAVLTVLGGMDGDKKRIEEILQDTWESADDWFC